MQRVRRCGRPFFRSRGRGFLARSGETGALRAPLHSPDPTAIIPLKTGFFSPFSPMRIKFSIAWKNFNKVFHTVEKSLKKFPYCGKILKKFSIAWKTPATPPFRLSARETPALTTGKAAALISRPLGRSRYTACKMCRVLHSIS